MCVLLRILIQHLLNVVLENATFTTRLHFHFSNNAINLNLVCKHTQRVTGSIASAMFNVNGTEIAGM